MAKAEINIVVNGEEKLKQLNQDVAELDSQSKLSTKSLVGWTAALAATGYAINQVVSAGSEYLKNLEDTNNAIVTTTELESQLSTSFSITSASILEQTGLWEAYREAVIMASNALDVFAGKEAILRQAQAESRAFNAETERMKAEDSKKRQKDLDKEYRLEQRNLTQIIKGRETWARIEKEALKQMEAKENAYEAELAALDANIDKIYAETDAQIANTQVKQEAVQVTDDLTESINQQANAHEQATSKGVTMAADANNTGIMGNGSALIRADASFDNWRAEQIRWNAEQSRLLKAIADSTRDTNDSVRGY